MKRSIKSVFQCGLAILGLSSASCQLLSGVDELSVRSSDAGGVAGVGAAGQAGSGAASGGSAGTGGTAPCPSGACDDGIDCTVDSCDEQGSCSNVPDDNLCDDGVACTTDRCTGSSDGECEHLLDDSLCDDGNDCTDDTCSATGCDHANNSAQCDDTLFCNGSDTCQGGSCSTHAGEPCPGASVCDESQKTCTGCSGSADCPVAQYGPWSACKYSSTCAESGSKTRTKTTYTCSAGKCFPSTSTENGTCTRTTDGKSCKSTTYGSWSTCSGFSNACDTTGTHSRDVTTWTCGSGSCASKITKETDTCVRVTNGKPCADDGNACTDDVCNASEVCTHPLLPDGSSCGAGSNVTCCAGACRNTDDDESHCGGCYVACGPSAPNCNNGYCRECFSSSDCPSGLNCNTNASPNRCQCGSCPKSWQYCNSVWQCKGTAP